MNRFLGTFTLVCCTWWAWSQTSGNPFDLKFRPTGPASIPTATPSPTNTLQDTITAPVAHIRAGDLTNQPDTASDNSPLLSGDSTGRSASDNPFAIVEPATNGGADLVVPSVVPKEKESIPGAKRSDPVTKSSKGFQVFFVLLSLLLIIFIVNVERSFVRDLWRVISNENYSSLHHRNQRNTMRQILLMMGYTVFVMQAGLFLFLALRFFDHGGALSSTLWGCLGLVAGVYLMRHGVIRYLRWLFNNDKEMTLFGFDISIFNIMVGLILLPVNILLLFGPESIAKGLIITGTTAIVLAYFMRQLRWFLTARHLIVHSLFLFFVYLCAVEILPLWVISKLFW